MERFFLFDANKELLGKLINFDISNNNEIIKNTNEHLYRTPSITNQLKDSSFTSQNNSLFKIILIEYLNQNPNHKYMTKNNSNNLITPVIAIINIKIVDIVKNK